MSKAELSTAGATWRIQGDLSFETTPGLYTSAREAMTQSVPVSIDLTAVERVDSSGVALMLDWIRVVRAQGGTLSFNNVPEHMISIAELCGVGHLLKV